MCPEKNSEKNSEKKRSRSARRTALRLLRPRRTGTAVLCAVSLVLAGAGAGAVAPARALVPDHPAARTVGDLSAAVSGVGATAVLSAAALVVGAALVVSSLARGGRGPLALVTDDPLFVCGLTRGAAARLFAEEARDVDGVSGARVRVGRRRVRVLVSTRMRGSSGALRGRVEESVRRRAGELGVLPRPAVRARVREVGPA
ncbi:DUF6286 domain-containing protein [Nocardiopsis changdeensis]|uniref:Alkaline shock response membrane anchor protein AmaP n=1 Tax=Nocardiopsis changdeensis TaxID=2831969 RepID=A0ABX8BKD4_9ACTN|nr:MULTISPECIES: DUF6286 domain-containing protein [Nocardiopsis]QUX22699.1 alkaline shock response membrane anchor protein AmaP [Nocardiopsis changdeensis]QYX38642.1 alkaline shock response membrane anchor protein AmaP [Nocardiopsis sp. MT53]